MNNLKPELERDLLKRFPEIFGVTESDPEDYLWGIDCGDGWWFLIYSLCRELQVHVARAGIGQIVACQIKQKMGILRCTFSITDEYSKGVIAAVVAMSYGVCELCGGGGQLARGKKGYIRVLCPSCRAANPD